MSSSACKKIHITDNVTLQLSPATLSYILLCSLLPLSFLVFFFNDTATTEIYTLSLHDALPIYHLRLDVYLVLGIRRW